MDFIKIRDEYTLQDVRITPTSLSNIKSRKDVNVYYNINDKQVLPIISSPMAYFTPDSLKYCIYQNSGIKNKFIYTLPRINPSYLLLQKYKYKNKFEEFLSIIGLNYKSLDDYYNERLNFKSIKLRIEYAKELRDLNILFISSLSLKDIDDKNLNDAIELINLSTTNFYLIDVANGYMTEILNKIEILSKYTNKTPIFGNIISGEIFYDKFFHNRKIAVRIGIGNGSECLTTINTGIGRPQLSALIDVYFTKTNLDILKNLIIINDGGIRNYADAAVALLFSDYIMTNYLFKNTELNIHNILSVGNESIHYGMASEYVKLNDESYIEGGLTFGKKQILYKVIKHFTESLQSTLSYLGISDIKDYDYNMQSDNLLLVSNNSGSFKIQENLT